jgi:hypothetical protein
MLPKRPAGAAAPGAGPSLNPVLGWSLAGLAFVAGYVAWGWRGLVLALTVTVFWLLLQFSRSLRVLRTAGANPVGRVPSAVMLHSRLRTGMTLLQVVTLTRSLGRKIAENPERWGWADDGGAALELQFERGRLARWQLHRAADGVVQADP